MSIILIIIFIVLKLLVQLIIKSIGSREFMVGEPCNGLVRRKDGYENTSSHIITLQISEIISLDQQGLNTDFIMPSTYTHKHNQLLIITLLTY